MRRYNAGWMTETSAPRLLITDALGRRIVVDRQAAVHDRPPQRNRSAPARAPTSRACTPRSPSRTASACSATSSRASARSSTARRVTERVLVHGDRIRFGQAGDTEIVFVIERRCAVGRAERGVGRRRAAADGGAARRAARARLGPRARRSAGARARLGDRGHRRRARLHHAGATAAQLEFKLARARGKVTLSGRTLRDQPQDSREGVRDRPADDRRGSARRRSRAAAHRHRRARHPPRAVHAAAPGALRRARRRARRRRSDRRAVSRQPRARRAALGVGAGGARDAQRRSGAGDRERAALSRDARQGEARAGAEGRRRRFSSRCCRSRIASARFSRPRRRRSRAAPSAATSSTTSICPPASSASSSATSPGKGSPAALLAAAVLGMFSAEATYQTGPSPLMTRLNHGVFRRAIEGRFLTAFYGMLAPDGALHVHATPATTRRCSCRRQRACAGSRPAAWCSACSSTRRSRRKR